MERLSRGKFKISLVLETPTFSLPSFFFSSYRKANDFTALKSNKNVLFRCRTTHNELEKNR